jgi:hypothetical protein
MQTVISHGFAHLIQIASDVDGRHTPQNLVPNGVAAQLCEELRP